MEKHSCFSVCALHNLRTSKVNLRFLTAVKCTIRQKAELSSSWCAFLYSIRDNGVDVLSNGICWRLLAINNKGKYLFLHNFYCSFFICLLVLFFIHTKSSITLDNNLIRQISLTHRTFTFASYFWNTLYIQMLQGSCPIAFPKVGNSLNF